MTGAHLRVAEGAEDEQRSSLQAAADEREQSQGRRVRPLHIVQHSYQRMVPRRRMKAIGDRFEQPEARSVVDRRITGVEEAFVDARAS